MEPLPLRSYRLEFAKHAEWRREEERRDTDFARQQTEKKREQEQDLREESLEEILLTALATNAEISDFTVRLDGYDTATIEALHENDEALAKVREELRVILDKAYILPDGRKVFKTEDGTRVFDEHGAEVKDLDPEQIEDWRPRWEQLQETRDAQKLLLEERDQLHSYQERLDAARERVGEEGLTKGELKELEETLKADMPDAVKRHLPEGNNISLEAEAVEPKAVSFRPAAKLDMPAL
ncbi:hypothetical protein [Rhizobium sp. RU36D]|uniref:hypothetical protein n=1 Tax=Rhizobium sp. RU36D TaxID=1907415 RepID=UPI0009D9022D|nr:hypothetical protein [Rhizobium sp. RU36D]SMD14991.1 hypothetical protein SAMN05880593_12711 [Rhizobium sp. RU36D]